MKSILVLWMAGLAFALAACSGRADSTPTAVAAAKLELAQVTSIEVIDPAGASNQISVIARGEFPDNCTQIDRADVEQNGLAFTVAIVARNESQPSCVFAPVAFEHQVLLDIAGLAPGRYPVVVNGISAILEIPTEENPPAQSTPTPEASPTAIQTAAPTPTPQASPTETNLNPQSTPTVTESVPASTPTEIPTQPPSGDGSTGNECIDKAAFYADVTVPDNTPFDPGESFTKTWKIRNEGTCIWRDYKLVFGYGDQMDGPLSNALSEAAPGQTIDVSVDLKAPARGGTRASNWQFENNRGTRFGVGSGGHDYIWVQIVVNWQTPAEPPPGGETPPSQPVGCEAQQNSSYISQILSLVNSARASAGLEPVSFQDQLASAAQVHSTDMACNDFINHSGSDGSTWYDRVSAQGYSNYASARENIYVGDPNFGGTAEGAFDWWMNSQVHRENILNPGVTEIGIAYIYNPSATYGGYFTMVLARP